MSLTNCWKKRSGSILVYTCATFLHFSTVFRGLKLVLPVQLMVSGKFSTNFWSMGTPELGDMVYVVGHSQLLEWCSMFNRTRKTIETGTSSHLVK